MTSIDSMPSGTQTAPRSASFGTHRNLDRPASAIRAGASSMPAAYETRGVQQQRYSDAPVRSFADMAMDPLRAATATPRRTALSLAVICLSVLIWLF